jgi:hypothetical protein
MNELLLELYNYLGHDKLNLSKHGVTKFYIFWRSNEALIHIGYEYIAPNLDN